MVLFDKGDQECENPIANILISARLVLKGSESLFRFAVVIRTDSGLHYYLT
jgi:hypothetical protein